MRSLRSSKILPASASSALREELDGLWLWPRRPGVAFELFVFLSIQRVGQVQRGSESDIRFSIAWLTAGGVKSRFVLPAAATSSRMPAAIFLQQVVAELDGAKDFRFGDLLAPGFHHHDAVFGAGHDDVELGVFRLLVRWGWHDTRH